jgi:hypothetical protein
MLSRYAIVEGTFLSAAGRGSQHSWIANILVSSKRGVDRVSTARELA